MMTTLVIQPDNSISLIEATLSAILHCSSGKSNELNELPWHHVNNVWMNVTG